MRWLILAALAATLALAIPASAGAAVIRVTTSTDEFDEGSRCSLREAITSSNSDSSASAEGCIAGSGTDTILVRPGVHNLTRFDPGPTGVQEDGNVYSDLDVLTPVTIKADTSQGIRPVVIDGPGFDGRVFHVLAVQVVMDGLWIRNGYAKEAASNKGGGILNSGGLTIRNSTISDNDAIFGGGVSSDGASALTMIDTTVSGNDAEEDGGGLSVETDGTMTLRSVTVSGNEADSDRSGGGDGGGIAASTSGAGGTAFLRNSLLAGNLDFGREAFDCVEIGGAIRSLGRTFITNPTGCSYSRGPGDVRNLSAQILPLTDNGGFTPTHALKKTSPAINKAGGCDRTDQRGLPRKLGGRCDIGAWELGRCEGVVINRIGLPGGVRLDGTSRADGFYGSNGADVLFGKGGSDGLCGRGGSDRLDAAGGNDKLNGGKGRDTCLGGGGRNRLRNCELPRRQGPRR